MICNKKENEIIGNKKYFNLIVVKKLCEFYQI